MTGADRFIMSSRMAQCSGRYAQEVLAPRTMGMAIGVMQRTFYELRAMNVGRLVHCLIELEHPDLLDPCLCWLQASVHARNALQRMPTPGELCQVTEKVAQGLRRQSA